MIPVSYMNNFGLRNNDVLQYYWIKIRNEMLSYSALLNVYTPPRTLLYNQALVIMQLVCFVY